MKLFIVKNTSTGMLSTQGGHVNTFDNKIDAKACRDTLNQLATEIKQVADWRVAPGPDHRRY